MPLKDVADRLVAHCRANTTYDGLKELYAADAVSVEAGMPPGRDREAKGIDAIRGKHEWWDATMEVHSVKVSDAMLHPDDRFAVIFEMDATDKEKGERMQMMEIGLYTVGNDKIVREEFFYPLG
ncbi:MAG: nuclear transport factor 2 family protein [Pseudomonadota bacterium]